MSQATTIRGPGQFSAALPWLIVGGLALAEAATALLSLRMGLFLHLVVLAFLITYAVYGSDRNLRDLALGLALVPLIRVLSLGLPLDRVPQLAWYPMVAVPLLVSTALVMGQVGLSAPEVGLRWGNVPRELALSTVGVALGFVEYTILRPASLLPNNSVLQVVLVTATLVIFTGLFEELLFRGLLQQLALRALGLPGLVLVSLVFAAMHIGYRSVLDLLFVGSVGLLFAYVVLRGRSLLGVTLAHGLTNVVLFVVMPSLSAAPATSTYYLVAWLAAASTLVTLGALADLMRHPPSRT